LPKRPKKDRPSSTRRFPKRSYSRNAVKPSRSPELN
jgi:hypothetical protein